MNVLQVIDKSFLGGGQTSVRNLLIGFRDSQIHMSLACGGDGPLISDARALATPVHVIPFDKRFRPGPARALASTVQRSGIDIVHAHGLVATFYCTLARLFFGMRRPIVYQQHGFHHHNYGAITVGMRKAIERAVCRRVERVVADSPADYALLESHGYASGTRLELILPAIVEPIFVPSEVHAARKEIGINLGEPVIGLTARLHPQKGVDVFLRAAALVHTRVPEVKFIIIGSGERARELHQLAGTLPLGNSLRWIGGRAHIPFLSLFTVAVISSRWEGLPYVLLDYMACGLPIVTTDIPGCLDAVGTDTAEVVPRESPEATAEAILRLLAAPQLARQRGQAAKDRFLQLFALSSAVHNFKRMYTELLQ